MTGRRPSCPSSITSPERSGGLGVLRLRGATTDPLQISLSLTERAAIEAAPADEIVRSEDGYIIVRVKD